MQDILEALGRWKWNVSRELKRLIKLADQVGFQLGAGNLSWSISEGVVNLLLAWPWIDILKNDLVANVCGMGVWD